MDGWRALSPRSWLLAAARMAESSDKDTAFVAEDECDNSTDAGDDVASDGGDSVDEEYISHLTFLATKTCHTCGSSTPCIVTRS